MSVADELLALCEEESFSMWHAVALTYRGAASAVQGAAAEARRLMQEGLGEFVQTGARLTLVPMNVMCAEAWDLLGEPDKAWSLLDEAQKEADTRRERMWEPEIDRVRARLLVARGDLAAAEASLDAALAKARGQKARSLELRAALDLSKLFTDSGRGDKARELVANAVGPFDTASRHAEVVLARALVSA